jgi:AcrR family transcriptional regulator
MTAPATRAVPLTQDAVVDAALRIVEDHGAEALTMRRLADEIGAAVTAIYHHVGNRDALIDLLVDRLMADMGSVHPSGRAPRTRIRSIASEWREKLLAHPHLIGLAHERAKTPMMFAPIQAALAKELARLGLHGEKAALAVRAVQCHVVASVLLERAGGRSPVQDLTDPTWWAEMADDPELVADLSGPPDYVTVFDYGLDALLATLPR